MQFKTQPFPHQERAYKMLRGLDQFALLADMGVGKSKIVIDLLVERFLEGETNRVLIIAPNTVHTQWINEQLPEHCGAPWTGNSYIASKKAQKYQRELKSFILGREDHMKFLTCNFESFQRPMIQDLAGAFFVSSKMRPTILVDEASRIKNPEAKQSKGIIKLARNYPHSIRGILTGTPAAKQPLDMWNLFEFLQRGYMGCSYTSFKHEYAIIMTRNIRLNGRERRIEVPLNYETWKRVRSNADRMTEHTPLDWSIINRLASSFQLSPPNIKEICTQKTYSPFKQLDHLQDKIDPITFSVSRKECIKVKPKQEIVPFELHPKQKELIAQLRKFAVAQYQDAVLTVSTKAILGTRILQICGGFLPFEVSEGVFETRKIECTNRKLNYLLEEMDEIGQQQFIVWAVFRDEIKLLEEALSKHTTVGTLSGDTKGNKDTIRDAFKQGDLQCLVAHPRSAGYGLNLQNASVQYWYSRDYVTEARLQALARNLRIGTVTPPTVKDLVYKQPFEQLVLDSLKQGRDLNRAFIDINLSGMF